MAKDDPDFTLNDFLHFSVHRKGPPPHALNNFLGFSGSLKRILPHALNKFRIWNTRLITYCETTIDKTKLDIQSRTVAPKKDSCVSSSRLLPIALPMPTTSGRRAADSAGGRADGSVRLSRPLAARRTRAKRSAPPPSLAFRAAGRAGGRQCGRTDGRAE